MRGPGRIAIVTDDPGWHGARLRQAFKSSGLHCTYVSLKRCHIDLNHSAHGIVLPGFERNLPDGVFVRGVPGGTLEQVVLRLDILHALRELGVPVYNDARAIERSVDKAMTSLLLQHAGVATPATWVTEDAAQARAVLIREAAAGHELVLKPLFGSQGAGLIRLRRGMDIPESEAYNGVYYLQRFVDCGGDAWHDWRVFVIGGTARAAMLRRGMTWVNNVAQGARCAKAELEPDLRRLAEEATRAVGMDYAGIDIIRDRHGTAYVLEVNSIPAWKGLQTVSKVDLALCLAEDFIARRLVHELKAAG